MTPRDWIETTTRSDSERSWICPGCGVRVGEARPECGCPGGRPAPAKIDLDDPDAITFQDESHPF